MQTLHPITFKDKTTSLIIFFVALGMMAIVYGGFFGIPFTSKAARVEIEVNGHKRAFEGEVTAGMTVLDAVQASTQAGGITFKYALDSKKNSLIIMALDGYPGEAGNRNLVFYMNSSYIDSEQIHVIPISPGDVVIIKTQ